MFIHISLFFPPALCGQPLVSWEETHVWSCRLSSVVWEEGAAPLRAKGSSREMKIVSRDAVTRARGRGTPRAAGRC